MARENHTSQIALRQTSDSATKIGNAKSRRVAFLFTAPAKLPPELEATTPLRYWDVGLFFISVLLLAVAVRTAVRVRLLSPATLASPSLAFQVVVSLFLIAALCFIVKVRHGCRVWAVLGWRFPSRKYFLVALLGGAGLALGVEVVARATAPTNHLIHVWDLLLLDAVLGPLLEESFFRGCLLPVLTRTTGPNLAVLGAALLFATLHPVRTLVQWTCFTSTGVAYGWMRTKSGSTAASTLMHATYNVTLFLCQIR